MGFDPKTNKFPYPLDTSEHYLSVKEKYHHIFDENYPYIDKSFKFRFKQFWFLIFMYTIVLPVVAIRLGLRVKGRKNLRKYKKELSGGVVTISNHVHLWDYLGILIGLRFKLPKILIWDKNINGNLGNLMRYLGGVPIPEDDIKGKMKFLDTMNECLKDNKWIHIYPEGSMWEFYYHVRPFKKGAAGFACKNNVPILPMAFSYRKPGIRKHLFGTIAKFTLHIGEPIFANEELEGVEQEEELLVRANIAVSALAGIPAHEKLYDSIYKDSKRIDYYTEEYGVNYKGSW